MSGNSTSCSRFCLPPASSARRSGLPGRRKWDGSGHKWVAMNRGATIRDANGPPRVHARRHNPPTQRPRSKRDDKTCKRLVLGRRARISRANATTKPPNAWSSTAPRGSPEQTRRQNLPTPRPQPPREDRWSKRADKTCQRLVLRRRARIAGANGTTKNANGTSSAAAQGSLEQTGRQIMRADGPEPPTRRPGERSRQSCKKLHSVDVLPYPGRYTSGS